MSEQATSRDSRQRSGREWTPLQRGIARTLLPAILLPLLLSCSSNRELANSRQTDPYTPPVQESTPASPPDTVPPAYRSTDTITLGERLGRLDAAMKNASGDSLAMLQEEYQQLLDRRSTTKPDIQTGPNTRDGAIVDTAVSRGDLKGLRKSELNYALGGGTTTHATSRTRVVPAKEQRKVVTPPSSRYREDQNGVRSYIPQSVVTSREGNRNYLNGLIAVRSGNYGKASSELPGALSGSLPKNKKTAAGYSYGLALEKTGKSDKAARQYLKASRDNDSLSHKSYLSYCRMIAKSGERTKARKLLAQFIQSHPRSSQVIAARQLLQTL